MERTKTFAVTLVSVMAALLLALSASGAQAGPAEPEAAHAQTSLEAVADVAPTDAWDCIGYLEDVGYGLDSTRIFFCRLGSTGGTNIYACQIGLMDSGVLQRHAVTACNLATW
ncbi:hypothetical protein ACFQS3_10635 [Glycomyces mayteni]|uniref:Secreted protein n=1 Tax=Glycomyces mayteni TaxID=543887 RepID=A0ABW2D8T6_9ACTN|nr:hypothetical protein GCM10025732_31430 [Glycomyces mayteni]